MSPEGKVKHRKFLSGNSESMARKDVGLQGDDKTSEVRDNRINRGAGMGNTYSRSKGTVQCG